MSGFVNLINGYDSILREIVMDTLDWPRSRVEYLSRSDGVKTVEQFCVHGWKCIREW